MSSIDSFSAFEHNDHQIDEDLFEAANRKVEKKFYEVWEAHATAKGLIAQDFGFANDVSKLFAAVTRVIVPKVLTGEIEKSGVGEAILQELEVNRARYQQLLAENSSKTGEPNG